MSSKQIARAAVKGQRIRFVFNANIDPIHGYVVGQDDFHWLVAHLDNNTHKITLIHKGSAALLTISPEPTLRNEDADTQAFVEKAGRGFWLWCDKNYFDSRHLDHNLEQAS